MMEGIYRHQIAGYYIWETEVEINYQGGIAVVWQRDNGWQLHTMTNYEPNLISFMLTTGWKRRYVVGAA